MDDYERTNASEWDLNLKGQGKGKQKSQEQSDNPAKYQGDSRGFHATAQHDALVGPSTQRIARESQPINQPTLRTRRAALYGRRQAHQESAWVIAEGVKRQELVHREPQPLLVDVAISRSVPRRMRGATTIDLRPVSTCRKSSSGAISSMRSLQRSMGPSSSVTTATKVA